MLLRGIYYEYCKVTGGDAARGKQTVLLILVLDLTFGRQTWCKAFQGKGAVMSVTLPSSLESCDPRCSCSLLANAGRSSSVAFGACPLESTPNDFAFIL